MWMNVANPLVMFLAVTALVATSVIIIYKLTRSARLQRDNAKRQDESVNLPCIKYLLKYHILYIRC